MGMLSLGINGSRLKGPPDRPLQDRPGARGLYPLGMLARTLRPRNLAKLELAAASAQGSGAHQSLRLPMNGKPEPDPWFLPGLRCQPRPGTRRHAPSCRGSGAPQHCPLGMALSATFLTRSRTERDTRRQSFPTASRGSEDPWARALAPEVDLLHRQEDSRRST